MPAPSIVSLCHLSKAIASNKVLSQGGLKYASQTAEELRTKGFGKIIKEGTQKFFVINPDIDEDKINDFGISMEV